MGQVHTSRIEVNLLEGNARFASVQFFLEPPPLTAGVALGLRSLQFHGQFVDRTSMAPGQAVLRLADLLPGSYTAELKLDSSSYLYLPEPRVLFEVLAGEKRRIPLEYLTGGMLEVQCFLQDDRSAETRAACHWVQADGSDPKPTDLNRENNFIEWKEGRNYVIAGGSPALTEVLPPGPRQLEVSMDGHEPQRTQVTLRAGETERVSVTLVPKR